MRASARSAGAGLPDHTGVVVVLVTAPSSDVAMSLVRALVERRLIACGTILPGATSIYRWGGAIEEAHEVQLVLKTAAERVQELTGAIVALHPYENPEVLVLDAAAGSDGYLRWVLDETERDA